MARLQDQYKESIAPALKENFGYRNVNQIPRLTKIVVSMGVSRAVENKAAVESAAKDLTRITGQKAVIKKAVKSVANFRLREGMPIGCVTTLRGERMYEFMDRLISVVLPRIRDFQGIKANFDGRGNFSVGLSEQSIFPEIELDRIEFPQGMNITFVNTATSDAEGRALLDGFGMPFRRKGGEN